LSADIAHPRHAQHKERHVVTLRYEARAERKARDTRTGLAAEPLVCFESSKPIQIGPCMLTSEHPPPRLASRRPIWSLRHDICRHNYAVKRGLVVGFCGHPHYCYRPYYPTTRFRSPSSYMVSDEPFPDRSRPTSC